MARTSPGRIVVVDAVELGTAHPTGKTSEAVLLLLQKTLSDELQLGVCSFLIGKAETTVT